MPKLIKSESQPTINDVARLSGVSKKTVSRIINRSPLVKKGTREKVEKVISELGYVPNPQARALALRRNFLIGLLHDNPNAQMVLNFQQGVLEVLHGTEFALVVQPVERTSPQLLADVRQFLEQQRPFGLLILPPLSENDALAELCKDLGCEYVRMGSADLDDAAHLVESNDRQAVGQAVDLLIEQGHRDIALIAGPEGFRSAFERQEGFREAMARHGLPVREEWVERGMYTFDTGLAAGSNLLDCEARPTAIFASNDEMAAGALHAARRRDLVVPDDLSIVGFDDTAIAAHIWPPMTTVRWPINAMARAAATKLVEPKKASEVNWKFLSEIISRSSVAPPR